MEFSKEEIHYIGMNFIGEKLQKMGYEFLGVNSKLKKHPQFVIFKKGEPITFVMVKTVSFPKDFQAVPEVSKKVIAHAKKQDSSVWFAGVGVNDAEDNTKPPMKGRPYQILFTDFKILHTHENN
ncbi:Na(+)-translocating NADH-quinone reductase subunit F [Flavobacteriaceae bacterium Ap0902]|nr:Na(+)-translocating NADH-quinone reductase subunit F [Flavobacteriaceae bacterium Ap0902]